LKTTLPGKVETEKRADGATRSIAQLLKRAHLQEIYGVEVSPDLNSHWWRDWWSSRLAIAPSGYGQSFTRFVWHPQEI